MLGFSVLFGAIAAGGLFTLFIDSDDESDADDEEITVKKNENIQSLDFFVNDVVDALDGSDEDENRLQGEASHANFEFAIFDINTVEWLEDSTLVVDGASIEEVSASNEPLLVLDTPDPDVVDVSEVSNAIVYSSKGDTVIGGDGGVFISVSEGGSLVEGGGSDDIYLSNGENDTIFAGCGNDFLLSGKDSSYLDGGDGNDTIYGSFTSFFLPTSATSFDELVDEASDTLIGGEGDDKIFAASGDRISSGSGDDTIAIFGKGAAISDFNPLNDTCLIFIEDEGLSEEVTYSRYFDSFQVVESDFFVEVYSEDDLILSVNNSPGLHISFARSEDDLSTTLFSNGDGVGPGILITSSGH